MMFFLFDPVLQDLSTRAFSSFLIIEYITKRIIVKRHCIRMAETEASGRFPVRAWFINRAALNSQWQRAIFAVRNEIMIRTYIL